MKNKFINTILLLVLSLLPNEYATAAPRRDFGAFSNVKTNSARMPFYRDKQLVFYMRSQNLAMMGKQLEAQWPVIDIIRKGIDVEAIAQSDNSNAIYNLGAEVNEVADYWLKRSYSEGVILTESAMLDQSTKMATGSHKVFVRTPMLDLNGVGFTADLERQIITVNSEVEIVLRNDGNQPLTAPLSAVAEQQPEGEKKSSSILAYCNELVLDISRNTITLIGNVRVFDESGTITSERLEIELENTSKPEDGSGSGNLVAGSAQQLRSARFIGNVRAVRKLSVEEALKGEQYAEADLAVYDVAGDTLEMTGSRPRLVRGQDYAQAERIVIMPEKQVIRFYKDCIFVTHREVKTGEAAAAPDVITADYADWDYPGNLIRLIGNAHLKSEVDKAEMNSDRLDITLSDVPKTSAEGSGKSDGMNSKRPHKVVAAGNVRLKRENNGVMESAEAGRITYLNEGEKILLDEMPVLRHGEDVVAGENMIYFISEERLQVFKSSRIVLSGATVGNGDIVQLNSSAPAPGEVNTPVTVESVNSDINYGGNLITFVGAVKVRGRGMKLDSDKLEIFLQNAPASPDVQSAASSDTASAKNTNPIAEKQPTRALATGNVYAEDSSGILRSGTLDIYFGDKAQPGKMDIEVIAADGRMCLQSKPAADGGNSATLLGNSGNGVTSLEADRGIMNLLTNEADFYDNVIVSDTSVKLECEYLKAVAERTADVIPSIQSYQAADEFPDRLAVGEGRELVRIIADKNVRMTRILPDGGTQKAKGDHAVYEVAKRTVVLSCTPPRRPQAVTEDSGMIGDKVMINLDTEELFVENGDVLTRTEGVGF